MLVLCFCGGWGRTVHHTYTLKGDSVVNVVVVVEVVLDPIYECFQPLAGDGDLHKEMCLIFIINV